LDDCSWACSAAVKPNVPYCWNVSEGLPPKSYTTTQAPRTLKSLQFFKTWECKKRTKSINWLNYIYQGFSSLVWTYSSINFHSRLNLKSNKLTSLWVNTTLTCSDSSTEQRREIYVHSALLGGATTDNV
jgi:hypothetical protein